MLFNSLIFIGFFGLVYTLYLILGRRYKAQNLLLLVASYIFYGYWDWRFLSLIAISTVVDYLVGQQLHRAELPGRRKLLLLTSVAVNLTMLGFFKYFNFFADSVTEILGLFGMQAGEVTLQIVLPVGISFYTFQTMSYTIDIYRNKIKPTSSFLDFALFVSFFPQLVAGPIERAANLLPQMSGPRKITAPQVNAGIFLVLWGFFKKVVIADNASVITDLIFNNHTDYQGIDLLVGVFAFTVQVYGDFSGYSDIARGISKLMGFELMVNFKLPYFALNPTDLWLRWHVSLSTWLRDYLYIPLGGSRGSPTRIQINLFLTMALGGLWHGADWNFILWGVFHGFLLIMYRIFDKNPEHEDPWNGQYSAVRILAKMALMMTLTMTGYVIFRSNSVGQIWYMFANLGFSYSSETLSFCTQLIWISAPLIALQIWQYKSRDLLVLVKVRPLPRYLAYAWMLVWILLYGVREATEFFYFQF